MWCSSIGYSVLADLPLLMWSIGCVLFLRCLVLVVVGEQGPFASKYLCIRNLPPAVGHLRGNEIQNLSSLPGSDEKWEFCCLWCPPGEDGV